MVRLVFVWILIGLVVAAIAALTVDRDVRVGRRWFIYRVVLWPAVVVYMLVVLPRRELMDQRELMGGTKKKCPYCAEVILAEAKVCKHCKRDLVLDWPETR
ncbi:MAG: hypothetical protein JSV66_13465 [Trueperaceae bacterium]|nr:MAG: hypothetical protein JSV66_13465 [Trueperaceae bacterium]